MSTSPPKIDARTAPDIAARLVELLEQYTSGYAFPAWKEYDPITRAPKGKSAALINIFARFAEIAIERLNQVPEKNFLAFLDLLGAERQPPQPARAPLTFTLAAGSMVDASVPQGTQVAAPPGPGEKDPVIFETERALVVTAAQLTALLTFDPLQDSYGDWSERLAAPSAFPVFQGDRAFEHVLYLGDSQLLGYAEVKNLRVRITLAAPLPDGPDPREVRWERWDGTRWQALKPTKDPTENLTLPGTIHFGDVQPLAETAVSLRTSRWLRCRLLTPITRSPVAVTGMVRESQLPQIKRIVTAVHLERTVAAGIVPDLGFTNAAPLDLSKDFFPFGEKPKLYDALFLASTEAFSKDRTASVSYSSARVDMDVQLANSHLVPGAGSVRPASDLELAWECWTGRAWQKVGTSTAPDWLAPLEIDSPKPLTTASTIILQGTARQDADVVSDDEVTVPIQPDGRFARTVTLAAGDNVIKFTAVWAGRASSAWVVVFRGSPERRTVLLEVSAPSVPVDSEKVALTVKASGSGAGQVASILILNGRIDDKKPVASGKPGTPIAVPLEPGRNALLIEGLDQTDIRIAAAAASISRRAAAPAPVNEFSDGTFGLCQSGVVTLRLPDAMAKTAVNGQENFWLRVRLIKGDYGKEASYALKDPTKPEDGFTLVQASFRPPIVAGIKIGYELTPRRPPEICFAYNQLAFEDCTAAAAGKAPAFAPFLAASEAERPGLYLGFSLPQGRSTFPNTSISLYNRLAEPKYGERTVPLSPEVSTRVGGPGTTVTHTLTITNAAAQNEDFDIAPLGSQWPTKAPASVTIEAGASIELAVQVSIPVGKQPGDSDHVFVRLSTPSEPDKIYGAILTTGVDPMTSAEPAAVAWQYWDGARWAKLTVQDDSENFARSGLIELVAPPDLASRALFGRGRYWLRAEWDKGAYTVPPRLARMLLNTTLALQTTTVSNEILGSSNGAEGQQFRSARVPVLAGQRLEVREPEKPSAEDQAVLAQEEGSDAINEVLDATGQPREIWVRWHEVPDFYGSGPRDRHYTINHLTGEIGFGDGVSGRIPPRGTGNLRLTRYQTGGGERGNRAAGTIAQLKTTVPYVERAANSEAAAGGANAETTDALIERMPRTLRHRDRAVTFEDYEDLALLATPDAARARCVPLRDLDADPLGNTAQPGAVSVIVVPRTGDVKPLPTLELLASVRDFLTARSPVTASLAVVGPSYIRVDVHTEIAIVTPGGASTVERAVHERLADFLHPLTGGLDGQGWDFGRAPHRSDFFALIESVPGVDHVRYLQITEIEDQPGVRQTGRFLVFSGEHQIGLVLADA